MSNKGKIIVYDFTKDVDEIKSSNSIEKNIVVDLRKSLIEKIVDDLVSINTKNEDLLEM
ncbi:MAG: hypothetical protein WBC58_03715 [Maribacter stanieri]